MAARQARAFNLSVQRNCLRALIGGMLYYPPTPLPSSLVSPLAPFFPFFVSILPFYSLGPLQPSGSSETPVYSGTVLSSSALVLTLVVDSAFFHTHTGNDTVRQVLDVAPARTAQA